MHVHRFLFDRGKWSLRPVGFHRKFRTPPGHAVVAVHLGDEAEGDFLGANGLAGASDGAVAEAFLVHRPDHVEDAAVLLGVVKDAAL